MRLLLLWCRTPIFCRLAALRSYMSRHLPKTSDSGRRDGNAPVVLYEIEDLMNSKHGKAPKAQDKSTKAKFNAFLKAHVGADLHLVCLQKEDVTPDMFGKFASFLLQDELVQYQTSINYLSSVQRHWKH